MSGESDSGLALLVLELGDYNGSPEGWQDDPEDALHHEEDCGPGAACPDGSAPEPDGGHGLHAEHKS